MKLSTVLIFKLSSLNLTIIKHDLTYPNKNKDLPVIKPFPEDIPSPKESEFPIIDENPDPRFQW